MKVLLPGGHWEQVRGAKSAKFVKGYPGYLYLFATDAPPTVEAMREDPGLAPVAIFRNWEACKSDRADETT